MASVYHSVQSPAFLVDPFGPAEDDLESSLSQPHRPHPVYYSLSTTEDEDEEIDLKQVEPTCAVASFIDWELAGESLAPLLLSLGGLLLTGMLLDYFQHWQLMSQISELFIIIPILLNLKGNLEMALASRLSTAAHLGQLDNQKGTSSLVWANVALVQVQALIGALGAAALALTLAWAVHGQQANTWNETGTVVAGSLLAMMISGMVTSACMVGVVKGCHARGINPDNIATPLAASLGDLTSLAFLVLSAATLNWLNCAWFTWLLALLIVLGALPGWALILWRQRQPSLWPLLRTGYLPCLLALGLTSLSGLLLERGVQRHPALALVVPVVSGLAGNLTSIGASRLSTHLHLNSSAVLAKRRESGGLTRRTLLLLNLPLQTAFLATIGFLSIGHIELNVTFIVAYLLTTTLHPLLLLIVAPRLVRWLWARSLDPDTFSLPLLTALGDCTGTLFILFLFIIIRQ